MSARNCRKLSTGRWSAILKTDTQGRREFAHDLEHLDQVGVENRPELELWKKRRSYLPRKIAYYSGLALIPIVILLLMIFLAHR